MASVLANDHADFELVVVDQSSDAATKEALRDFEPDGRFRYVHLDRVGLSHAYNFGIALTAAPLLAFTDDDCVAPPDWLRRVEEAFERHPDVEMLYGQTLAAPALQEAAGVLPALPFKRERRLSKTDGFEVFGMGANFALRRPLIERVGGFDEALGGGGPLRSSQDFDQLYRAYKAGAVCLLAPSVWVHHFGIREGQAWTDTMRAYGIGDGAFYLKHIRCGDFEAARMLVARVARLFVREIRKGLARKPMEWIYLRSYLTGMRLSLRFQIDRRKRLYKLGSY